MTSISKEDQPVPIVPNMSSVAHGPNGETAQFVLVTPEIAADWLTRNINTNRNIKKSRINGYVRDIRAGNWVLTGEAIKFDTSGNMIDGQNRCTAIVAARQNVWALVVTGVKDDALLNLDSGSTRTGADMLTISGIAKKADAKDIAAIARLHTAWHQGDVSNAASTVGGSAASMTRTELAEAVISIPNIEHAARMARSTYWHLRLPVGAMGVAYLEFLEIDVSATNEFFGRIRDGVQTGPGDPFLALSRRAAADTAGVSRAIAPGTALFYLFRTWNAFRSGEPLHRFQIGSPQSGWTPIPEPK